MTDNIQELDKILKAHGAEPGEMTYSLKQALLTWHQQEIAKARIDEWKEFGEFLSDADKRVVSQNFLDLYRLHGERLLSEQAQLTNSQDKEKNSYYINTKKCKILP